jgi:general secretion pathway protein G
MEVLLVLVILVILGSIAVPIFTGTQEQAEKKSAQTQVSMLARAIDMYRFDTKKYPANLQDLTQRPGDKLTADRWAGPYLEDNKALNDPWDNPYKYAPSGKHNAERYDVWSLGPDGQDGSADDIGNWQS